MDLTTRSIKNKKATFQYFIVQKYTAGIVLTGTEIKSVRTGLVNLGESFCFINNGELYVKNMHISPYKFGTHYNHDPLRVRKLLLTKRELRKIESKLKEKGLTMVPIEMYLNERKFAKLDIALVKGKKYYDKRDSLKQKDTKREIDRAMKERY